MNSPATPHPSTVRDPARLRAAAPIRDDRILPEVRGIAGVVVIVLLVAAVILYLFPDRTADLFAWTIHSKMSALLMGAGYGAGAYYFARVVLSPKWHWVGLYFPAITTFTTILGLTTILYWDRFNQGTIPFYAWVLLYFITPFLLPLLWLRNRRTDPGTPDPDDVVVPQVLRIGAGIAGAGLLVVAAGLILLPNLMISLWPWPLTPPVSLSIGGWISAPGVCNLLLAFEPRWSAWRILLQHQALAVGLILLAVVRAWPEFNPANPVTWLYVGGMTAFLIVMLAVLYVLDGRRGKAAAVAGSTNP